jgi:predicted transposase YbfD/YdcC
MNIEKADEYRKIVEKLATKTTVKNSYTHNNYLNYISSEPIRFSEIPKQLKDVVTTNSLMFDDLEFHEHIVDNILRDENGKDKVLCTDINRKNFSYKDENSGELICDPELERLREQLRKGTDLSDIKNIKKELLNMLIKKYEGTSVDPYVKFYEILKKLDFGGQFVDHIAKKTYVKTMTSIT